jgi:peptide/nickel transport system permease protein
LGSLLVDSIERSDVPVVQGVVIVMAAIIVLVNLLVDLLYPVVDPSIRVGERGNG